MHIFDGELLEEAKIGKDLWEVLWVGLNFVNVMKGFQGKKKI